MFNYRAGVTTAGAADEIVDWFATFQLWMTADLGWTVAAGGGTTDVYFRSLGEAGGLAMLFLHVYRDGGNPNRVRIDATDDIVPTHFTDEGGYVDGAGAQFAYWMSGDMDAIVVCFRGGAVYNTVYAGLVMPFAQAIPDETYAMIATSLQNAGSILRDSTGVWDVDHPLYEGFLMSRNLVDRYDGSFTPGGTYFDQRLNIAGQLKHISCTIMPPALTAGTPLTTGRPGATTTWIVLQDRTPTRYAMRTGGVLPAGIVVPGGFASAAGVAANYPALWAAMSAHLTGIGWTDLGDPGWGGGPGRLYFSTGTSGEEEIYIGYANDLGLTRFYSYVQDDPIPTHMWGTGVPLFLNGADFPINYWLVGDMDCSIFVFQRAIGYAFTWSGLCPAFAPGLLAPYAGPCLTPYQLISVQQGNGPGLNEIGALLRSHNGVWNTTISHVDDGPNITPSNPSNFDGVTYLLWPKLPYESVGADVELTGQLRYMGSTNGGGVAAMDTITIGAEVYTVFIDATGLAFCVRTI